MIQQSKTFEQVLEDNLALYVSDPDFPDQHLFKTHREISLARYALSKQAEAYARTVEILLTLIDRAIDRQDPTTNPQLLSNLMVNLAEIERRSSALINSVRSVTELLGKAVTIDVDKASLSALVIRLPSLVRESINKVSNDPHLADRVSSSLDSKISELMIAMRFTSVSGDGAQVAGAPITVEQYHGLINTIPQQPLHQESTR